MRRKVLNPVPRNATLDAIKAVAALSVVYIHCGTTSGCVNFNLNVLSRFAVPFFFMVSGYFLPSQILPNGLNLQANFWGINRYLTKIVKLTFVSTILYWLWYFFLAWKAGCITCFFSAYNNVGIYMWIVHNDVPHGLHLWYFYALIYSVAIMIVILSLGCKPKVMMVVAFALICYDVYCEYHGINFVRDYHIGLPCLILGYLANFYELKLMKHSNYIPLMIVVVIFLSIFEGYIRYNVSSLPLALNIYTLSVPIAFAVLLLGLYKGGERCNNIAFRSLKYVGRFLSAQIFILHPLVSFACKEIYQFENSITELSQVNIHSSSD